MRASRNLGRRAPESPRCTPDRISQRAAALAAAVLLVVGGVVAPSTAAAEAAAGTKCVGHAFEPYFSSGVAVIMAENTVSCTGPDSAAANVRLQWLPTDSSKWVTIAGDGVDPAKLDPQHRHQSLLRGNPGDALPHGRHRPTPRGDWFQQSERFCGPAVLVLPLSFGSRPAGLRVR